MIDFCNAIYKLYPNVLYMMGMDAFDAEGNKVEYDTALVEAEVVEVQAERAAAAQAVVDAKQSALNKLMALGLTEEEALALGVK